jgi:hypothetical protein
MLVWIVVASIYMQFTVHLKVCYQFRNNSDHLLLLSAAISALSSDLILQDGDYATDWTTGVRFLRGAEITDFATASRPALGFTLPPRQLVQGILPRG